MERSCTRPGARAQGPRVWRAEPPGSGRGALWHSKGGHPGHMYTARAAARSQPVAVARPHLRCVPAWVKGGRAQGWSSRWRGCAERAGMRRVCGRGGRARRGCALGAAGRCGAGKAGGHTLTCVPGVHREDVDYVAPPCVTPPGGSRDSRRPIGAAGGPRPGACARLSTPRTAATRPFHSAGEMEEVKN